MKKKLIPLMLASSLALGATFTLASCNGENKAEEMIKSVIITNDGQAISQGFKVPASLKRGDNSYNLLWNSNSEYLTVSTEASNNQYDITVTRPEDNKATAVLTAELDVDGKKATKDFTFYINPIDVDTFIDTFKFDQKGAMVDTDFTLPQSFAIGSKSATIAWESQNPDLVSISEDGKTAHVAGAAPAQSVQLKATFTYKGTTGTNIYAFKVTRKLTDFEKLRNWYEQDPGFTQEINGYVVAKDSYSDTYNNCNVYISDANVTGGYYSYQVKCDKTTYDKLTFGTRVVVKNAPTSPYNGLGESKGGTIEIVTGATPYTESQLINSIDNDFIADTRNLFYKSSSLVSLTGWKVDSVSDDAKDATKYAGGATLVTLTRTVGDKELKIKVVAKKGLVIEDAAVTGLVTTCTGLKKNDIVNIKGILGYNSSDKDIKDKGVSPYSINVIDANSIVKADTTTETEYSSAPKVAAAIKAAEIPSKVYEDTQVDLPSASSGATISWSFSTDPQVYTPKSAVIENNKLIITPKDKEDEVVLVGTFTSGTYTVKQYYTINTIKKTKAQMVTDVKTDFINNGRLKYTLPGTYTLNTEDKIFNRVGISYALGEQKNSKGEIDNIATISADGKTLTIGSVDPDDTHYITYTVTFTLDDQVQSLTYKLTIVNEKVTKAIQVTDAPENGKSYKFGVNQENKKAIYYFTGKTSGNFLATSTDVSQAIDVTITKKSNGKYTLSFKDKNDTKYIALKDTTPNEEKKGVNAIISDTEFEFDWDTDYHTFKANIKKNVGDRAYYIGAYGQNVTLSSSIISYAATSFTSALYTTTQLNTSRQKKVEYESEIFDMSTVRYEEEVVTIPTIQLYKDVTITATAATADAAKVEIKNGKITFKPVDADTTATVTFKFACGGKEVEKPITFNIKNIAEYQTVTEVITAATPGETQTIVNGTEVAVKGVVYSINSSSNLCWITDGTNKFEVYGALSDGVPYTSLNLGDVIYVVGKYKLQGTTHEVQVGSRIIKTAKPEDADKLAYAKEVLTVKDQKGTNANVTLSVEDSKFKTVAISWEVISGTYGSGDNQVTVVTLDADGKTLHITPALEDATITLRATLTLEGLSPVTKDITFKVAKKETVVKTLTADSFGLTPSYATNAEGTSVEGFTLAFSNIMKANQAPNTDSIQFKKPSGSGATAVYSTIKTLVATESNVYKFVLSSAATNFSATTFKVTVSKTAEFTEGADTVELTGVLVPDSEVKAYSYTAESGFTFFKIECVSGTGYLASIVITLR